MQALSIALVVPGDVFNSITVPLFITRLTAFLVALTQPLPFIFLSILTEKQVAQQQALPKAP